jgi:hypothetical protein
LILQQAALEAIAWHDIVQHRKMYSEREFDKDFNAARRIRLLLSQYEIAIAIPSKCTEIASYATDNRLNDLVVVLVNVRNAFIHGSPKNVDRVLGRLRGDDERTELWYQVGGLLDQTVLAISGFNGHVVRRDVESVFRGGAVRKVSWANDEGESNS